MNENCRNCKYDDKYSRDKINGNSIKQAVSQNI